jgi:hypothetical protein
MTMTRRIQFALVILLGAVPAATTAPGTPCLGPARGSRLAYVLSPGARDAGRRFTTADAATLARLGFDAVRLGIVWEGLEPGPAGVGPNDPRYCSPHAPGMRYPRAVARHYRGDADVLGYELYNEPADRSVAVPPFRPRAAMRLRRTRA